MSIQKKTWELGTDLREKATEKILSSLFQTMKRLPDLLPDEYQNLMTFSRSIENKAYRQSTSEAEYWIDLTNQIFDAAKHLKEKRERTLNVSNDSTTLRFVKPNDLLAEELLATWRNIYCHEPECNPFKFPVNPEVIGAPDYFKVIKNPIDLCTIHQKFRKGEYKNPWNYILDMWLMFENAWSYNKKNTQTFKSATKLSQVFDVDINVVMRRFGYCCGSRQIYQPSTLGCYGQECCRIRVDAKYFTYKNLYYYCERCFKAIREDSITLNDFSPEQPQLVVTKSHFEEKKNNTRELEPFVTCVVCDKIFHAVCVLYLKEFYPSFTCDGCLKGKNLRKPINIYTAKNLPKTKLGTFIEKRLNNFIKNQNAVAGEIIVRVVECSEKTVEIKPAMKGRYPHLENPVFPYRNKVIYVFELIDDLEVAFFALFVQEYGSNCPAPNTRRVYISYLDSVHFFQPREYRTVAYHEILLGYLQYTKQLGFEMAHIWACPPAAGSDYIFYFHPPEQKFPKAKRLQEWYKTVLEKGVVEGTILEFKNVWKQAVEDKMQKATDLPYFAGDLWPDILEKDIEELEKEAKRKKNKPVDTDDPPRKLKKKVDIKKKNGFSQIEGQPVDDLSEKLFEDMLAHKDLFFVVRLNPATASVSKSINDPDPLIPCSLMDGREAFLSLAREKHYEFSTLRRAKYATMGMLHELHINNKDMINCNCCSKNLTTLRISYYSCTVCQDFDLCSNCMSANGHIHEMKWCENGQETNEFNLNKLLPLKLFEKIEHAAECEDENCAVRLCSKTKKMIAHAKICPQKTSGGCKKCVSISNVCCYHSKSCTDLECRFPFCQSIKLTIRENKFQNTLLQNKMRQKEIEEISEEKNHLQVGSAVSNEYYDFSYEKEQLNTNPINLCPLNSNQDDVFCFDQIFINSHPMNVE